MVLVKMKLLEVFLHPGCLSEDAAMALVRDIRPVFPELEVRIRPIPQSLSLAQALGIKIFPAFVLDERVLAVGVPRKEWLVAKLRRVDACPT